jgi:hypothetical protein
LEGDQQGDGGKHLILVRGPDSWSQDECSAAGGGRVEFGMITQLFSLQELHRLVRSLDSAA